jgi:hypothetical protein
MKTTKPKITMAELMKRPGMAKANPEIALKCDMRPFKPYDSIRVLSSSKSHSSILKASQIHNPKKFSLLPTAKFELIWRELGGLELKPEHQFHPFRRFKFDFAHTPTMIAIEIEGGIFMKRGGHSSITGILRDIEKYNFAALMGWKVFRLASNMMKVQDIKPIADHIAKVHKMIESFGI